MVGVFFSTNMQGRFSVFGNIRDTERGLKKDMPWVVERIRSGSGCKDLILKIRSEVDPSRRNDLKMGLTSICFSGTFKKRNDRSIQDHSGYMVTDFDHVADLPELRETLQADPYTCLLFTSPSGDGLKMVVKVPAIIKEHKGRFDALMQYFDRDDFDPKNGNLSRVCYESWDPDVYYNPESKVFEDIIEHPILDFTSNRPVVPLRSDDLIIERLRVWIDREHPVVEGQRNDSVFRFAGAMNRCGVSKVSAESYLVGYAGDGFTASEISKAVASAYRNTEAFGTGGFEDRDTADYIFRRGMEGALFDVISSEVESKIPDKAERMDAIEKIVNDVDGSTFWRKSPKGVVSIDNFKFKMFLQDEGFRKMYPAMGTAYVFVKVEDNLVSNTSESVIKDFVMAYVEATGDRKVFNYMAGKSSIFKEDFLSMLDPIGIEFVRDTPDYGTLFYQNCAVRAYRNGSVKLIDYADLGGYVWSDHILDRDFERDTSEDGEFSRFVDLISSKDAERIKAHRTSMGYLMHGHKDLSNNRAVVYNDAVINDNPNGGSGKGIVCQAYSKVRRVNVLDGKSFSFDKGFPYQTVSADCQILVFDDVPKKFSFERLFSVITEGIVLERKNKDAVKIPVQHSPKIILTTNYTIEGRGGSHERRKWEVEMAGHFNANHTPADEFGHQLFDGWDDLQWRRFDNYMVNSLLLYLKVGLYQCSWESIHVRKFINETSHEFWQWIDEDKDGVGRLKPGENIYRSSEMDKFVEEYSDFGPKKYGLTHRKWVVWLDAYAVFKGWEVQNGKNQIGHYTRYVVPGEKPVEVPVHEDIIQTDMPF